MASKSKNEDTIAEARSLNNTPWCEEYEKMISGMLYNPLEPKLCEARHRARALAFKYNSLDPGTLSYTEAAEFREGLLREMLGKVGEGTFIEPPFLPDYGVNVSVGKNCFMNFNLTILDTSLVVIGDRVQIATGVTLAGAGHETSVLSRIKFIEFGHPIRIEDDCWIGANVTILPGVTIGKGCTIGAGSVVTRDIPPYSVAVGIPARVIKTLPTVEEERADPNNPLNHLEDRE